MRVKSTVELVIKGTFEYLVIEFYFYAWPTRNLFHVDDRYVVFLKKQGGVWRAVRDNEPSAIEVGTGRQSKLPRTDQTAPKARIAALLLTCGEDIREKPFRRLLIPSVVRAEEWIGYCRTRVLLTRLMEDCPGFVSGTIVDELSKYLNRPEQCNSEP
jgi:hypothetical protein